MYRQVIYAIALVLLIGAFAGPFAPIQPAYATSDSMEPGISPGDLYFVAKAPHQSGVGDIAMFYSTERGEYVTHRLVDHVDGGFITQGDANPTTDQAAGYAPVPTSSIVGPVLTVKGQPLTVPGFGSILVTIQSQRTLVALLLAFLVVIDVLLSQGSTSIPTRDVILVRDVLRPLLVGGLVVSLVLIGLGASTHELTYVATDSGNGPASVVKVGEPAERSVTVDIWQPPLTTAVVTADGVEVLETVRHGSSVELTIRVPAQSERGPHRSNVHVTSYPATLPRGVLTTLQSFHWVAAISASLLPVFGPAVLLYTVFFDGNTPIHPWRSRWLNRFGGG